MLQKLLRNCFLLSTVVIFLFTPGCKKEEITMTWVPKESTLAPHAHPSETPPSSSPEIQWSLPKGWVEKQKSSMRVGSFTVRGRGGREADVSVIPLAGQAGGLLANVNRWRGQIRLGPVNETQLSSLGQKIKPGKLPMILFDFGRDENRIVAAVYERGSTTWFFKMSGDNETVKASKKSFIEFLESLRFKGKSS